MDEKEFKDSLKKRYPTKSMWLNGIRLEGNDVVAANDTCLKRFKRYYLEAAIDILGPEFSLRASKKKYANALTNCS